jgi:hypothetical protein
VRELKAALATVALAMLAGTLLGIARTLWLQPAVGRELAIALETPVMLAFGAVVVRRAVSRFGVADAAGPRLATGALILLLLVAAEDALNRVLRGGSVLGYWAHYSTTARLLTAAGLVGYALLPLLVGRRR